MKKKLAIIGASYLQLPLIIKANEMDLETHVFAWEDGAVGKNIADYFYPISIIEKEQILEVCREVGIDGIISIASDIAMPTVNFIADKLQLTGNNLECTLVTTDKFEMRNRLSSEGISCPNYILIRSLKDIQPDKINEFKFPIIVKPTDRSGSRGVTKVTDPAGVEIAIENAFRESLLNRVIVEEFINGHEISVEMISWKGAHHFLAITDKVTNGPPNFVEIEQHEPLIIEEDKKTEILGLVKKALTVLGLENGASHSELIISDDGNLHIIEVGARMGGDNIGAKLVEMSTGFDFVKAVINIALGIEPKPERLINKYAGIYYLTPPEGLVKSIDINLESYPKIVNCDIFVKPGDRIKYPVKDSSERSGYFMYLSDEPFKIEDPLKIIHFNMEN